MIGPVMIGAFAAVVVIGGFVLVLKPAEPHQVVRWSALAITVLVAAALTPYVVADSGAPHAYLLWVPVVVALLPILAARFERSAGTADLVAAVLITAWALVLGLGVGSPFLPVAVLFIGSAASGLSRRSSTTA